MPILDFIDTPRYWFLINVIHAFLLGPVLLYTGWTLLKDSTLNSTIKDLLPFVGAVIIAYHSIRAYQKYTEYQERFGQVSLQEMFAEYGFQVNLAHLLFIGPLIAWVGFKLSNGRSVTQLEKLLLVILGGAGTVYHTLSAYRKWF